MTQEAAPPELRQWHNRIARMGQAGHDGHLLVEAVYCYGHGDDPVWEIEWTARLTGDRDITSYENGIRLDWEVALDELSTGRCSWAGATFDLDWLDDEEGGHLRYQLFD